MKYFLFCLLILSCNPPLLTLKGDCSIGETKTFKAPNGEYITATLKGIGYLHLSGNLNLMGEDIIISTELGDTVYTYHEAWYLEHGDNWSFEICLEFERAKEFEFELIYL